ncbi:hypothetical protein [Arthrobacter sp. H35-D1]|uniref:hypothetical protein n=1 Tax=Arthrobacter sp. H35-D1 TaxID=3046202 RepID=UPI0024B948E6|nr:hypothetical protein [Arthrobacter sp. H35-D1]MDJ0314016.1 hypothetical protein [Arthrobacter sp. H35-D1]
MATITRTDHDQREPLTWTNMPKHQIGGVSYLDSDSLMTLIDQLADEEAEFLERLSRQ